MLIIAFILSGVPTLPVILIIADGIHVGVWVAMDGMEPEFCTGPVL